MPSAVVFGRSLPFDRGVSFSKHAFGGDFPTPFHSLYRRNISPAFVGYRISVCARTALYENPMGRLHGLVRQGFAGSRTIRVPASRLD
jgi:hypothetical protein